MNIYNSVLLDTSGLIQQVRTTLFTAPLVSFEKCITLYTYSPGAESAFTRSFLPFRFVIDDNEPGHAQHHAMQELILAGTHFVNGHKNRYAELVIAPVHDVEAVIDIVKEVCEPDGWKAVAWRTTTICNYQMTGISIEN